MYPIYMHWAEEGWKWKIKTKIESLISNISKKFSVETWGDGMILGNQKQTNILQMNLWDQGKPFKRTNSYLSMQRKYFDWLLNQMSVW